MYFPPLGAILNQIKCSREDFNSSKKIAVPAPLLRLLFQLAITNSDFNEEGYLNANVDVKQVIHDQSAVNPNMHYIGFGYFEGRTGATPDVDEAWYLKSYSDVLEAINSGQIASAQEHFDVIGAAEGRSPDAHHQIEAFQWKKALAV